MKLAVRFLVLVLCLLTLSPAMAERGIMGSKAFDATAPAQEQTDPQPAPKDPQTDAEIRQWYNDQVAVIPTLNEEWIGLGLSAEARARLAYSIRHNARIKAREFMASETAVRALRARDRVKYGNPDGPTFDYLVRKMQSEGLEGDAIYEGIVGSANRTNRQVNERYGVRTR